MRGGGYPTWNRRKPSPRKCVVLKKSRAAKVAKVTVTMRANQGRKGLEAMTSSEYFLTAYRRAVAKIGEAAWSLLSTSDQAEAIYREFRSMDAERSTKQSDTKPDNDTDSLFEKAG
jgi:hypothetical protein